LKERVRLLEVDCENEKVHCWTLVQTVGEWRMLTDGLVEEVGRLRDDLARVTWVVANRLPPSRAAESVGLLVPIDNAEPVPDPGSNDRSGRPYEGEIVDETTDESTGTSGSAPQTSEDEVVDFGDEEDEQEREAARRGEVTFNAAIVRARADPSPEYRPAGRGTPPPYV